MSKNSNITAIAFQEIWSVLYPELVNIDGFTLVCKTRGGGRGGGVGFYLRSNIKYKIANELSIFLENEFESLTVETTINHKKNPS
jgi:hypothetical protein